MKPDKKDNDAAGNSEENVNNTVGGAEDDRPIDSQTGEISGEETELSPEDMTASQEYADDRIDELKQEVADLKDKLLRSLAEAENVRRRAGRDREDASKYAIANFAREMLSVSDNLKRALDSVDENARNENETLKSLVVGVEMTEREMLNAFNRIGIKAIASLGKKFDHNFHEALFEIEDKEKPSGTVVQEVQVGYTLNDRLLRPAKVGISKGGSMISSDDAAEDSEPQDERQTRDTTTQAYEKPASASGASLDEEL